ncbi:MAG: cell wall hydrolase [Eubacterium sp.]|nr:cell wall hydrolase [Eubacterium sp.]
MRNKKMAMTVAGCIFTLSAVMAAPVYADTNAAVYNNPFDTNNWSDKAVADLSSTDGYALVRSEADSSGSCVGVLTSGALVTVEGEKNGWTKISSGNVEGYVRSDLLVTGGQAEAEYLSENTVYGTVIGEGTPMYAQESTDSSVVLTLEDKAGVTLISADQGWFKVTAAGQTGYIATSAVSINADMHDAQTLEAFETSTGITTDTTADTVDSQFSDDEVQLLAALIHCEAGGESYTGKVAVGAVVLNRVNSSAFPNTISEVIYQSGQFTPASSGALASTLASGVDAECYAAAEDALQGSNPVGSCLYFHAGGGSGLTIGNQTFY